MITEKQDQVRETRDQMRGGDGTVILDKLCPELPAAMRLFSRITLAPGCSIGYHVHENETELFYFAQGRAEVRDDDAVRIVEAGSSMATASGHGHAVKNIGSEDVVLVAVIVKDR